MQQLVRTKRNLTLTFLAIILGIIFLLGASFLCIKYVDSTRRDYQEMLMLSDGLKQNLDGKQNDFLLNPPPFLQDQFDKDFKKKGERERIPFNVVLFNKEGGIEKKVISSHSFEEDEIKGFYSLKTTDKIVYEDEMIFKFVSLDGGKTLLFFKPLRYPISDFFFDALLFLVVVFIFSFPLFFILRSLVSRTMKPVEENMKDMQDFVHNAGHELKTPLAVMHGNLQIAGELKAFDLNLNKEMIGEIEKMNQLIEGLIELSNINTGIETVDFSVSSEIKDIVESFSLKLKEREVRCEIDKQFNLKIKANKGYFYIFFSNLFLNALKYNVHGGRIDVTIKKGSIEIKDTGVGIEKEFHEKIFERFFKVDSSRNTSGFGIGLSLVKKVADIYHWKILVKSEKGKGTSFEIFF